MLSGASFSFKLASFSLTQPQQRGLPPFFLVCAIISWSQLNIPFTLIVTVELAFFIG